MVDSELKLSRVRAALRTYRRCLEDNKRFAQDCKERRSYAEEYFNGQVKAFEFVCETLEEIIGKVED